MCVWANDASLPRRGTGRTGQRSVFCWGFNFQNPKSLRKLPGVFLPKESDYGYPGNPARPTIFLKNGWKCLVTSNHFLLYRFGISSNWNNQCLNGWLLGVSGKKVVSFTSLTILARWWDPHLVLVVYTFLRFYTSQVVSQISATSQHPGNHLFHWWFGQLLWISIGIHPSTPANTINQSLAEKNAPHC